VGLDYGMMRLWQGEQPTRIEGDTLREHASIKAFTSTRCRVCCLTRKIKHFEIDGSPLGRVDQSSVYGQGAFLGDQVGSLERSLDRLYKRLTGQYVGHGQGDVGQETKENACLQ
jgi:hypothetical protein